MKPTQEKTMEWRNKIRSVIAPLLIEELRRSGTMAKVAHATLLSKMTDELYALLASSQDSLRRKVEEEAESLRGFSRCPDLWIKIKDRLQGNIGMKGVSDFSFSQIALEVKDTVLDELRAKLKTLNK